MSKTQLKKFDKHGGTRFKKTIVTSQALFLDELYQKFGGIVACSEILGVSPQYLVNCKKWDGVPLKKVGHFARTLELRGSLLNYEAMSELLGLSTSWEQLVKDYWHKEPEKAEMILKKKHPKGYKSCNLT